MRIFRSLALPVLCVLLWWALSEGLAHAANKGGGGGAPSKPSTGGGGGGKGAPPSTGGGGGGGGGGGAVSNSGGGNNNNNNNNNNKQDETDAKFEVGKALFLKDFALKSMDFNAARETLKPFLVYIYDPAIKPNKVADRLEKELFTKVDTSDKDKSKWKTVQDPDVKKALDGMACILVKTDSENWPKYLLDKGKTPTESACIVIITPQNSTDNTFRQVHKKTELLAAAEEGQRCIPALLAAVKVKPLEKWLSPAEQKRKDEERAAQAAKAAATAKVGDVAGGGPKQPLIIGLEQPGKETVKPATPGSKPTPSTTPAPVKSEVE